MPLRLQQFVMYQKDDECHMEKTLQHQSIHKMLLLIKITLSAL